MGRGMNRRSSVDEPTMEAPTESPGQVAYEQGRERFLANDIRGAIARFEEAARLMPSNAQVQKQLGRAHMRAGSVADAVAAYRRYLELAPNAPDRAIIERLITQAQ
jgi:Flp pilus assembly protein TadD